MKVKKFVINLDRRPDRLADFLERYNGFDVERFRAVDGRAFLASENEHELKTALSSRRHGNASLAGILGCWLSHLSLWQLLANSNYDAFVIFEDDAFFSTGFKDVIKNLINDTNVDTHNLIYFGGRFKPGFKPRKLDNWEEVGKFFKPKKLLLGPDLDRTTHGYVLTRRGAVRLLELYENAIRLGKGMAAVDGWLNENRLNVEALDVFPHVAYSPINFQSDIQKVND